ncbi:MAG: type IV secretory system conjugative DNA transfer family protein [Ruminococcus sp.]|nr:type IV secretory system conjugative DNA transfer family protein [Ruminococcus sp.]
MQQYAYKYRKFLPPQSESHWASADDICMSNTAVDLTQESYPACGIPLYRDGDTVYVNNGDDHTLIFGSTGSKKTRTCVFPFVNMALRTGESVVCTDPKGEIYAHTADAAKKMGYEVLVLNFRDFSYGEGYNPLTPIWDAYHNGRKDEAIEMINDFIESISASQKNARGVDPFWWQTAQTFGVANMLFLMKVADRKEANISSFTTLSFEQNFEKLEELSQMMDQSTIAGMSYRCIFGEPERTRRSTQSSLTAMVQQFFCNKRLQKMMGETTFDLNSVGRKKSIVYLILSDEKNTYYFLVTTFLKQLYESLIHEAQKEDDLRLPLRVNFVLDEFGNIPEISSFCNAIAAARSRNIRYILIAQSLLQLENKYGATGASIIKANCNDWIFLNSKELPLLNEISQLCGSKNTASGCMPLISVPELQRLKKEWGYVEALVLSGRNYPFMARLQDIDSYEMFKTDIFAEQPEKKFRNFSMLDFVNIYNEIKRGQRRCPFLRASEDDSDDLEIGTEYLEQILAYNYKMKEKDCTESELKEAIQFSEELNDDAVISAISLLPDGDEALAEFKSLLSSTKKQYETDPADKIRRELERKFDELFGALSTTDEED